MGSGEGAAEFIQMIQIDHIFSMTVAVHAGQRVDIDGRRSMGRKTRIREALSTLRSARSSRMENAVRLGSEPEDDGLRTATLPEPSE